MGKRLDAKLAAIKLIVVMKKLSNNELDYVVKVGQKILEKRKKKGIKVVN